MKVRFSNMEWANALKGFPFLEEEGRTGLPGDAGAGWNTLMAEDGRRCRMLPQQHPDK